MEEEISPSRDFLSSDTAPNIFPVLGWLRCIYNIHLIAIGGKFQFFSRIREDVRDVFHRKFNAALQKQHETKKSIKEKNVFIATASLIKNHARIFFRNN